MRVKSFCNVPLNLRGIQICVLLHFQFLRKNISQFGTKMFSVSLGYLPCSSIFVEG